MSLGIRLTVNADGSVTIQQGSELTPSREHKGQSLLKAAKSFVAIDLETTGLSPVFDDIIELGAVRYEGGVAVESFDQLVNPGYEIDEFITELTGITNDMLAGAPGLWDALPNYLAFIGSALVVGHNVNFDVNFLYDACADLELPFFANDFVDTMRIARRLYKDWPSHRMDEMIKRLGLPTRSLHRAAEDAALAGEAYLKMQQDENFEDILQPGPSYNAMAKSIVAREGLANENSPLYGKVCVFTGTLESFTRREAMQLVADIGGICGDGITKKTNFLILGNNDYCKSIKDGKSSKQKKAEKLILEGADLQIIPEAVFLDMLSAE